MAGEKMNVRMHFPKIFPKRLMIRAQQVIQAAHKYVESPGPLFEHGQHLLHRMGYQVIIAVNDVLLVHIQVKQPVFQSLAHGSDGPMAPAGAGTYKQLDALRQQHPDAHHTPVPMSGRGIVKGILKTAVHCPITSSTLSANA